MSDTAFDLIVIGSGPGGYVCAIRGAQLGLKTALFAGDQRSLRLREHDPRCSTLEPDLIITKLSQLL